MLIVSSGQILLIQGLYTGVTQRMFVDLTTIVTLFQSLSGILHNTKTILTIILLKVVFQLLTIVF